MSSRFLNLAHSAISGTLIVFSFGGLALFSHQFWSLIQHIKHLPPGPLPEATAAAAAAVSAPPKLA